MNYHNITTADMMNGEGLRVVLWLSGCSHHCYNCQNPQTWDINGGILFDESAKEELFRELDKDYISGLTLSGGDPLHEANIDGVLDLVNEIRLSLPQKTIWLYTGYTWENIFDDTLETMMEKGIPGLSLSEECGETRQIVKKRRDIISVCDVLIDGKYIDSQRDITLPWRGSSNQRVIDIQKSLQKGEIVLWQT